MTTDTKQSGKASHADTDLAMRFLRDKVMPNFGRIFWAFLILVLLALSVTTYLHRARLNRSNALAELAAADSVESLTVVAERHAGDAVGAKALLAKAQLLMQQDDAAAASVVFREFLDQYENHRLATVGRLGLGAALEAQGEWGQAYDLFLELAEDVTAGEHGYVVAEAWYSAGRCAEALGEVANARVAYENVVTFGSSAYSGKARDALLRLGVAD